MQRGHVQITLLAGLKHLLGDAVPEVELVVLKAEIMPGQGVTT